MNIKEMEERSGLNRANIRYYEKEGLLIPGRKENGYRDYSEDNLEELKRIRLFRELEVPIDKIKELQNSPEALEQIMRQHIFRMEQQMKHLQDAITVCKDIQLTGVSYNHINVEQYLEKLRRLERNLQNTTPETSTSYQYTDVEQTIPHPFVRYVARSMDFLICQFLMMLVWNVLLHQVSGNSVIEGFIRTIFATVLMLFLEPLCISIFRTTPGKQIFGITLNNLGGEKLTYREALQRTVKVIFWGLGWNLPIFSLYRLYKSYGQCVERQSMEWDMLYTVDYQIPERTYLLPALYVVFYLVLSFFLLFEISLYEMTPPNQGDLTLEEYVENYNYYVKYYAIKSGNRGDLYDGVFLGEDGQIIPEGSNVIKINDNPDITYEYSYENDYVTGVSFSINADLSDVVFFDGYMNEMLYPFMAFTAAQEDYHAFNFKIQDLYNFARPENMNFQDYHITFGEVTASCEVSYDTSLFHLDTGNVYGFMESGGGYNYDISFSLSK